MYSNTLQDLNNLLDNTSLYQCYWGYKINKMEYL